MSAATTTTNPAIYSSDEDLYVVLKGRVVLEDLAAIKEAVMPTITRQVSRMYVDLQSVDFVDSAGLGLLIGFKMTSKMHGASITLLDPNKNVTDVLSISRIDGIFELLSGPKARAVREKLVQPENRIGDTNTSGSLHDAFGSEDASYPQVTSTGAFQDGNEQANETLEGVEEQCRMAVESMRQGNYEKSIECYKAALELDNEYLPALNNLAIVYEKQPTWLPLAIETWNRVLDLSRKRKDDKHIDRAERHLADLAE